MKKILFVSLFVLSSSVMFSNGLNKSPVETLIPDDAQLTFSPNSWEKTSYDKTLFDLELDQSLLSLGFGYQFSKFKIGLRFNSDYSLFFPHKSYSETVTETLENGTTTDKTTVQINHDGCFGEETFNFDCILNLGFGDHFGIFLHPAPLYNTTYLVPRTETTVLNKDGEVVDRDFVSYTWLREESEDSLYALTYNFYINDVFVKTLGGLNIYETYNVSSSDDQNEKNKAFAKGRFDLGVEIPQEDNSHEIDFSFIFTPETTSIYESMNSIGKGVQNSGVELSGDYIFSYALDNSGIFSVSGGMDFYSGKSAYVEGTIYSESGKQKFSSDGIINKKATKITAVIPVVKLALKYPLIQEKLFLSLGSAANLCGYYKEVNTNYSKVSASSDPAGIVVKNTTKNVYEDKVPMQADFYGGLIFDLTDSFSLKTNIDLGTKDVTKGILDYSFTLQGTYKL